MFNFENSLLLLWPEFTQLGSASILPHSFTTLDKKTGSTSRFWETALVPPAAALQQPFFRTKSTSLLSWLPLLFSWREPAYRQPLQFPSTTVPSPMKAHHFTFPTGLKGSPASIMPRAFISSTHASSWSQHLANSPLEWPYFSLPSSSLSITSPQK